MQDPDKEIQLESYRKEARARRVEQSRERKRKMDGEGITTRLKEEESEEEEGEVEDKLEKEKSQKGSERIGRKRKEDGKIRSESRTREGSKQRTESKNRANSKQRSESKQRASSSQRPIPTTRTLQQPIIPQEGDGSVKPKKGGFFDCARRQPSQSNLEMEISQNDTPSLTDTEEEMTDANQDDQILEIDGKLKSLSIDANKRKSDAQGQSPPRKIKTPESLDSGRAYIHRLPELPMSETPKQQKQTREVGGDLSIDRGLTDIRIRPQDVTYMDRDGYIWQDESNVGLELIDDIEKDNEILNDKLDEAMNRYTEYEAHMEERINEMNKMLLDREEELTIKISLISSLNKEVQTMKEDARIASSMIASKQIKITDLQKEIEALNIQIGRQSNSREEEIRGLQNSLAILQSGISTTDEMIVKETKELHKKIAILTQKSERLQLDNEELEQLLKDAREEARKHELTSRTYVSRLGQARATNVQRSESRMSLSNERRVLVNNRNGVDAREERNLIDVGNSPEIPDPQNDQQMTDPIESVITPTVAAPNAHQLLKAVDWPKKKTCFQHDDFCQKVSQTFQRHLAKGIPGHMLAESLHTSINRQDSISRMYNAELGNAEITFPEIMQALRNCDREFMEMSNYQKWNNLVKQSDESIHSFCKRVYKGYVDYNVGEEGNEDMKMRLIKERIIKGANLPKEVSNSIIVCENLTKLPGYILQAMKSEISTEGQAAQRTTKTQYQSNNQADQQLTFSRQPYQQRYRQPFQQNYRYRQQFSGPPQYQKPASSSRLPIPAQPPRSYQSQQQNLPTSVPQNQEQQPIPSQDQQQNEQSKTIASVRREFTERAASNFEQNNRGVDFCTNCRRIQCGHRAFRCPFPPFCSYCNREGHNNGDHRSRAIEQFRQRQRQSPNHQTQQPIDQESIVNTNENNA